MEAEARAARLHLSRLYPQALELSDRALCDGDAARVSHEDWQKMFTRFGALPVNFYGECLHPLQIDSSETCLGDLADDLADIWRDLKHGLRVFDAGQIDGATFEWHQSFTIHWGQHAASAPHILQYWIKLNTSCQGS